MPASLSSVSRHGSEAEIKRSGKREDAEGGREDTSRVSWLSRNSFLSRLLVTVLVNDA